MLQFLVEINPFDGGDDLKNIQQEKLIVRWSMLISPKLGRSYFEKKYDRKNIYTYSFSRKDMIITIASKSSVKVEGEDVQIDPNLIFQRLAALCNGEDA